MSVTRDTIVSMLEQGQDPKPLLIEMCKPECLHWQQKLERCENALRKLGDSDPDLSCIYPFRDWVTCVDGCANPKIFHELVGIKEKGWYS